MLFIIKPRHSDGAKKAGLDGKIQQWKPQTQTEQEVRASTRLKQKNSPHARIVGKGAQDPDSGLESGRSQHQGFHSIISKIPRLHKKKNICLQQKQDTRMQIHDGKW